MKQHSGTPLTIGFFALTLSLPGLATNTNPESSTITISVGNQSLALREQLQLPQQNQSMHKVLDMLGEPNNVIAVGKPKITRWIYDNMTVYFEGDQVLRAVVHHNAIDSTQVANKK